MKIRSTLRLSYPKQARFGMSTSAGYPPEKVSKGKELPSGVDWSYITGPAKKLIGRPAVAAFDWATGKRRLKRELADLQAEQTDWEEKVQRKHNAWKKEQTEHKETKRLLGLAEKDAEAKGEQLTEKERLLKDAQEDARVKGKEAFEWQSLWTDTDGDVQKLREQNLELRRGKDKAEQDGRTKDVTMERQRRELATRQAKIDNLTDRLRQAEDLWAEDGAEAQEKLKKALLERDGAQQRIAELEKAPTELVDNEELERLRMQVGEQQALIEQLNKRPEREELDQVKADLQKRDEQFETQGQQLKRALSDLVTAQERIRVLEETPVKPEAKADNSAELVQLRQQVQEQQTLIDQLLDQQIGRGSSDALIEVNVQRTESDGGVDYKDLYLEMKDGLDAAQQTIFQLRKALSEQNNEVMQLNAQLLQARDGKTTESALTKGDKPEEAGTKYQQEFKILVDKLRTYGELLEWIQGVLQGKEQPEVSSKKGNKQETLAQKLQRVGSNLATEAKGAVSVEEQEYIERTKLLEATLQMLYEDLRHAAQRLDISGAKLVETYIDPIRLRLGKSSMSGGSNGGGASLIADLAADQKKKTDKK